MHRALRKEVGTLSRSETLPPLPNLRRNCEGAGLEDPRLLKTLRIKGPLGRLA